MKVGNIALLFSGMLMLQLLFSSTVTADNDINPDLLKRVEKLEKQASEQAELFELQLEDLEQANEDIIQSIDNGMKVAGYADVEYRATDKAGKTDGFRIHHLSLFFSRNFTDDIKFFSEIEFEDAPKFQGANTHEGKIFVEAVNFDYLYIEELNLRVGRFFTPAGIWSEDHYPPFVTTQERPKHIRNIFPQLVDGASAYGTFSIAAESFFQWTLYYGNGESKPANGHNDENSAKALGFRGNFILPLADEFNIGFSAYSDGKDQSNNDANKKAFGIHAKLRTGPLTWQSEWATAKLDFNQTSNNDDYNRSGYYLQVAYGINQWRFGGRYDFYDNNDIGENELVRTSTFLNYQVNENVLIKAEFHHDVFDDPSKEDINSLVLSIAAYLGQ